MTEFPSQSHRSQEPREVQPVTLAPGRVRKPTLSTRFKETFFKSSPQEVWGSMFWDVFMRGITDNLADSFHEGVDTLFRGQGGSVNRIRRQRSFGSNSQISKHNPDRALGRGARERISREDRDRQNVGVIEIDSRAEAEEVLAQLNQSIDQFDVVTLAEFYQMVRITPDHTDYGWGWTDLGGSEIVHSRGSYYLDLPPVVDIRRN